jgi:hypothetical protein
MAVSSLTMKLDSAFSMNGNGKVNVYLYKYGNADITREGVTTKVNPVSEVEGVALQLNDLITFNDDITTEDVKGIYDFFEKSYMAGDSLTTDIKVKLTSDNIVFSLCSTNLNEKQAKGEFVNFINDILQGICNNAYAVLEDDKNKIKKFINKFYE